MVEEWRDIDGFEGLYQISSLGRVKSLRNEKILSYNKKGKGYLGVNLWKNGNGYNKYVHRLVAKAFIPNHNNLPEVNHKDEIKEHNCVENLEWCNRKYNVNYGTATERRSKRVLCVETDIVFPSSIEASRQTGVNQGNIISCCRGNLKKTKGFHWKYVE